MHPANNKATVQMMPTTMPIMVGNVGTDFRKMPGLAVPLVCTVVPVGVAVMVDGAEVGKVVVLAVDILVVVWLGMEVVGGGADVVGGGADVVGGGADVVGGGADVVGGGADVVGGDVAGRDVVVRLGGMAGTRFKAKTMLFREMAANTSAHAVELPMS
jgi:hypothetical protein